MGVDDVIVQSSKPSRRVVRRRSSGKEVPEAGTAAQRVLVDVVVNLPAGGGHPQRLGVGAEPQPETGGHGGTQVGVSGQQDMSVPLEPAGSRVNSRSVSSTISCSSARKYRRRSTSTWSLRERYRIFLPQASPARGSVTVPPGSGCLQCLLRSQFVLPLLSGTAVLTNLTVAPRSSVVSSPIFPACGYGRASPDMSS